MNKLSKFVIWLIVFFGIILISVITIVLISALFAFPIMWLWNWLMPTLFCLAKIDVFQAFGLNMLCGLLIRTRTWNKNQYTDEKISKNPRKIFKEWIKKNKQELE